MSQTIAPDFEKKLALLREELTALAETIISAHKRDRDMQDLDAEIANVIQWRIGIEKGEA